MESEDAYITSSQCLAGAFVVFVVLSPEMLQELVKHTYDCLNIDLIKRRALGIQVLNPFWHIDNDDVGILVKVSLVEQPHALGIQAVHLAGVADLPWIIFVGDRIFGEDRASNGVL